MCSKLRNYVPASRGDLQGVRCLKKQDRRMEAGIRMRSRNPDGNVQDVRWRDDRVRVYCTDRDDARLRVGVRQVVTL